METDRQLLELAAKAAGVFEEGEWFEDYDEDGVCCLSFVIGDSAWNPIENDGDAFRLLMELCITIKYGSGYVYASHSSFRTCFAEHLDKGKESSIRRAIVRVAAEIGRKKQNEASNGN